jgi:hypothetical protein
MMLTNSAALLLIYCDTPQIVYLYLRTCLGMAAAPGPAYLLVEGFGS